MGLEEDLKNETEKWLDKIKVEREKITLVDNNKGDFLKNIDNYISDSKHFFEKNDLIKAFEAVVWAWSWLEIGKELGILK